MKYINIRACREACKRLTRLGNFRMSTFLNDPREILKPRILVTVEVERPKALAIALIVYPNLRLRMTNVAASFLRTGVLAKTLCVDLTLFANRLRHNLLFLF